MLYLLGYALSKPLAEYPELVEFIDRHTPEAHVMENLWLLRIADLPYNLQHDLKGYLGPQDSFYLVDVSKSIMAWSGLEAEVAEFIGLYTDAVLQDVDHELLTVASDGPMDLAKLTDLGAWRPIFNNLWHLETDRTPEMVSSQIRTALGDGPRILVADVSLAPASWSHLPEESAYAAVVYTRKEIGTQLQEF
ncbi:hypothetical protein [Candidatus Cyanaurora vandensis]|uniref:hypothetical protein n=1 Tax=Candidatus Cyanaurora vandensis TaxID=2714958 RepID=UPI00257A7168|nr:hypothetical protein [Candidatus Cyanaurora vandensis]